ncbi:uncharacterized protein LOC131691802 [Topomyia yanbarensis]|uniref:uncharacterized protein LOC131691802 n=1 Tax=Topomyia yanbarensis TaxID=2498891 RepID=UPI00273CB910|nr:uncharacterized protein LOC131691802 [Topomyia yanbarensis]
MMRREYIILTGCYFIATILSTISQTTGFGLIDSMMLNHDILEMLRYGGFDTRQPARIFLPPKFYSSIVFDSGHRSPEEILRTNLELMMEAVYDGSHLQRNPSVGTLLSPTTPAVNRPNAISYSEDGAGNRNKGSGALGKNDVTNFKSFLPSSSLLAPYPAATRKTSSNYSSIVADQTRNDVPQIVSSSGGRLNGDTTSVNSRRDGSSLGYNLRLALPGEPDVDYPILGHIPETGFTCFQRRDGYYADVEARCQVFRVCANTDDSGSGFAFLCPNGTLFNQKYFVCDWYMNVRCEESENYYDMNEEVGKNTADFSKMMGAVMSMVSFPMVSSLLADGEFDSDKRTNLFNDHVNPQNDVASAVGGGSKPWDLSHQAHPQLIGGERFGEPHAAKTGNGFQSKFNQGTTYGEQADRKEAHVSVLPQQVYVSSLGTLSTDPQSGFDPVKSTILIPPTDGYAAAGPPRLGDGGKLPSLNQQHFNEENAPPLPISNSKFELLMANLLKSWTETGYAKTPTAKQQVHNQILPPTGVLPPSPTPLGFHRLPNIFGTSQIARLPSAPHNPNLATVQKVFRVKQVYVTPQSYYPASYFAPSRPAYSSPPAISWARVDISKRFPDASLVLAASQPQISRRNDAVRSRAVQPTTSPVRRDTSYDVEVVPAFSYYLNDATDRQSYEQSLKNVRTVSKDVGDLTRQSPDRSSYSGSSSYNVPIGSIGPLYASNN